MTDIAMLGDGESVLLAKAAGIDAYSVNSDDAGKLIHKLAKGGVKVIFVTEELYLSASEEIGKYSTAAYPAIIPIPGGNGSLGVGMDMISKNVEKAIGVDIFSEDDK